MHSNGALKKRQVILAALKKRIRKTTHKYGIEIPTSVDHAFELDRKNGNSLWNDALETEMYNIGVAFEILEGEKSAPAGYTKVSVLFPNRDSHNGYPTVILRLGLPRSSPSHCHTK